MSLWSDHIKNMKKDGPLFYKFDLPMTPAPVKRNVIPVPDSIEILSQKEHHLDASTITLVVNFVLENGVNIYAATSQVTISEYMLQMSGVIADELALQLFSKMKMHFYNHKEYRLDEKYYAALLESIKYRVKLVIGSGYSSGQHFHFNMGGAKKTNGIFYVDYEAYYSQSEDTVANKAKKLPGMKYRTTCPDETCKNRYPMNLYELIQHINDIHKWDRQRIADWLDKLHDDGLVDLSFKTVDTPPVYW